MSDAHTPELSDFKSLLETLGHALLAPTCMSPSVTSASVHHLPPVSLSGPGDHSTAHVGGGTAKSPSFSFSTLSCSTLDMGQIHKGTDVLYLLTNHWLCMGYIGALKTKFCTRTTCSMALHKDKFTQFWAGLYLKEGANAAY
eukprot:3628642-Ditylum_brightwellii.AAC.1